MNHDPRPIPEHIGQQLNQTIDDFNQRELAGLEAHPPQAAGEGPEASWWDRLMGGPFGGVREVRQ